jgi:hypothetical protein
MVTKLIFDVYIYMLTYIENLRLNDNRYRDYRPGPFKALDNDDVYLNSNRGINVDHGINVYWFAFTIHRRLTKLQGDPQHNFYFLIRFRI